jgi:hypothetical protein
MADQNVGPLGGAILFAIAGIGALVVDNSSVVTWFGIICLLVALLLFIGVIRT